MADILNEVMQMQSQGMRDSEIVQRLRNENISPKDINDALNQAKVKQAVSQPTQEEQVQEIQPMPPQQTQTPMQQQPQIPQQYPSTNEYSQSPDMQQMEQSIMQQTPQNQMTPEQQYPTPQQQEQYAPEQQEYYYPQTPQAYSGQEYYPQASYDTDTITEIAEQVVTEKFAEFQQKTGDLVSFKNEVQDKLTDLSERLKRIEDNIDNLQQAIINKIGEFGQSTESIHQDLDNLHGTMSKLMNPLIDNYKELKKISKSK